MVPGYLKDIAVPIGDSEMNPQPAFVVSSTGALRVGLLRGFWSETPRYVKPDEATQGLRISNRVWPIRPAQPITFVPTTDSGVVNAKAETDQELSA